MSKKWMKECTFTLVDSAEKMDAMAEILKTSDKIAVDLETTERDWLTCSIVGISICARKDEAFYVPILHADSNNVPIDMFRDKIVPILKTKLILYYNASFDRSFLKKVDCDLEGEDVMILLYHFNTEQYSAYGLKDAAKDFLGREMIEFTDLFTDEEKKRKNKKAPELKIATKSALHCLQYAGSDAINTWLLYDQYRKELPDRLETVYKLDNKFLDYVMDMQEAGFNIDIPYLLALKERLTKILDRLQERMNKTAGFEVNPNSSKSVWTVLQNAGVQPNAFTKTGKPKFDADTMVLVDHPFAKDVNDFKMIDKLIGTFIDNLIGGIHSKTGKCHSMYTSTWTSTGRLSSTDHPTAGGVNSQQVAKVIIPDKKHEFYQEFKSDSVRKGIVPPPGYVLLSSDWSAVELRIAAHFSEEPIWMEGFSKGEDLHQKLADHINNKLGLDIDRSRAKNAQFNLLYAFYWSTFAQNQGISMSEAQTIYEAFFSTVSKYNAWREQYKKHMFSVGYAETLFGRRRILGSYQKAKALLKEMKTFPKSYEAWTDEQKKVYKEMRKARSSGDREGVNQRIQGTCLDINKQACLRIRRRMIEKGLWMKDVIPMMNVHDEVNLAVRGELIFNKDDKGAVKSVSVSPLVKEVISVVKQEMETAPTGFKVPLVAEIECGLNWKELYSVE